MHEDSDYGNPTGHGYGPGAGHALTGGYDSGGGPPGWTETIALREEISLLRRDVKDLYRQLAVKHREILALREAIQPATDASLPGEVAESPPDVGQVFVECPACLTKSSSPLWGSDVRAQGRRVATLDCGHAFADATINTVKGVRGESSTWLAGALLNP